MRRSGSEEAARPACVVASPLRRDLRPWLMVHRRLSLTTMATNDRMVRCSQGHLFTTIWIPGISFKAVRLGMTRFQHCPVGHHWTKVAPVNESELTEEERHFASEHHDIRIP